jgi:hypothetical protein
MSEGLSGIAEVVDVKRESPFACDMQAIEPAKRPKHLETASAVFRAVKSISELPNGYAFQLPNESDLFLKVAEFISLERLCCPFFGFTLEIEPEGGSLWLRLTGREGIKPFIRAELGEFLGETAAGQASLNWGG